ncbi:MAG: hypothetical protein ACYTHK_12540 [Planctomycetota bacterium]
MERAGEGLAGTLARLEKFARDRARAEERNAAATRAAEKRKKD